ncbi:hypothetical protein BMETH_1373_1 [methanotrophic bacterial endosymbiont of Bathymodiolus sp.]|nr:hypothetical protein BMETH_1373_1 [methanotrophic bacterial endosymbiont of Bathymodiolus sp.]
MINKNNTYHPCLNTLGFGAKPQLNFSVCEANTLTWFYANKEKVVMCRRLIDRAR